MTEPVQHGRSTSRTGAASRFLNHVAFLLFQSLEEGLKGGVQRRKLNVYTEHGLPAYISAVAAVEAFVNEGFLMDTVWDWTIRNTPLGVMDREWVANLELSRKLLLVPQVTYGATFDKDKPPYQDMTLLIRLRNHLTHFKMDPGIPKEAGQLAQRGIALNKPPSDPTDGYLWLEEVNCTEGIRWAYNTAAATMKGLRDLVPPESRRMLWLLNAPYDFSPITEQDVRSWFVEHEIDPDSSDPPSPAPTRRKKASDASGSTGESH